MQITGLLRRKKTLIHSVQELIDYLFKLEKEDLKFVKFKADEQTLERISPICQEWSVGKECVYVSN